MKFINFFIILLLLAFGILFSAQNFHEVSFHLNLHWIGFQFNQKLPFYVFLLIFFGLGILLTCLYFFFAHTRLLILSQKRLMEMRRLKQLALQEREKNEKLNALLKQRQTVSSSLSSSENPVESNPQT